MSGGLTLTDPPLPLPDTHTHAPPLPGAQVEQAIFLSLMRLREKTGAVKSLSGGSVSGGNGDGHKTAALVKDSRRGRRDGNIGDYTRALWSSLGAGDAAATAAATAAAGQQTSSSAASGGAGARGGAGDDIDARPGGPGGGGGRYWAGKENSNHLRLLAFTETLAAGESALSPGVFEVGGDRRAEVNFSFHSLFWYHTKLL